MGARPSKPSTFVLQNPRASGLDIPIQFTPGLLRRLQGANDNQLHSSAEAGYTDDDLDKIVQDRVARELSSHQQRRLIHEQRSADQVRREAEDLIRRQKSISKITPKDDFVAAEAAIIQCYTNNPTRTLDCWKEVQAFKDLEKRALKDFVATAL